MTTTRKIHSGKGKFFLGNLVLVLGGILFALILGELSTKAVFYAIHHFRGVTDIQKSQDMARREPYEEEGEYLGKYDDWPVMRYSGFLSYSPLENNKGFGYVTNEYGFRYNGDFPAKKPKEEIRIFVTGGSTAWGAGASQQSFYAPVLEKILQKKFPDFRIRVISAGAMAYLSTHERILILNKISELEPDIVIMFSGWNDTYAGYRGIRVLDDHWDYFDLAPILVKYNSHFSKSVKKEGMETLDMPDFRNYTFKIHYLIDRNIYNLKKGRIERGIKAYRINDYNVTGDLIKNIKIINDLAKRQGFVLVFYLQPTLHNTHKTLTQLEKRLLKEHQAMYLGFSEFNARVYDLYKKKIAPLAEDENFLFVDGDNAISKEPKTVFCDHVHFGDRGNRLIAMHMSDFLTDQIKKIIAPKN